MWDGVKRDKKSTWEYNDHIMSIYFEVNYHILDNFHGCLLAAIPFLIT